MRSHSDGSPSAFRIKLTFLNNSQSENLDDFPVLVVLNPQRVTYSNLNSDGTDIRFLESDGSTVLSYDMEEFNSGGDSYIWVKVPRIDGSSNTDYISMYFGNTDIPYNPQTADVWSNGYAGVWHLQESQETLRDSTINGNHGVNFGTVTAMGRIGGAVFLMVRMIV